MKTRLYLDFDGVVNISRARKARPWTEDTGWADRARERLIADGDRWTIHYAPALVAGINALADEGVEIIWCSTWEQHTATFQKLGFQRFPWLPLSHRSYLQHGVHDSHCVPIDMDVKNDAKTLDYPFWDMKTTSVLAHMAHDPARAVWVDDDLSGKDILAAEESNVHALKTTESIGITPDMLKYIRTYLHMGSTE